MSITRGHEKWVVVADDDRKTKRVARPIKNVIFLLFDAHNKRDESAMLGSQAKIHLNWICS